MSSDVAIRVDAVSKYYHIYDRPEDRLKHAVVPRISRALGRTPRAYGRDFWALRDVSFDIARGETVGLIGRNGSGKSTLLQIICGTLEPSSGSVEVKGRVAALLELGSGFNLEFSGRDNVYMNAAVLGLPREEIDRRYQSILDFADIGTFIDQPVKTYSSGMFVRLAFAVSVSIDPDVLVIDEALAVGDLAFQQKCLQRLADLRQAGTTILLVTHDIMLTRNYCSQVVYLDAGQVRAIGDAETVGEHYLKDVLAQQQSPGSGATVAWKPGVGRMGFGTERGAIVNCTMTGGQGGGSIFKARERATITVEGRVQGDVLGPEIIVQFRDVRGYVLYGVPTSPSDLSVRQDGDARVVSAMLDVELAFGPGEYSVALSLNDRHGERVVTVLDKVVSAVQFTVERPATWRTHGSVVLDARWQAPHAG